jgi:hypothetical protein
LERRELFLSSDVLHLRLIRVGGGMVEGEGWIQGSAEKMDTAGDIAVSL